MFVLLSSLPYMMDSDVKVQKKKPFLPQVAFGIGGLSQQ